ncbi:DUF4166 domain-containing protein [Microbacterium sp. SLBN-146]|uniref:DUF4166 domain-containing protein n=1 Tax=Microbacterium sp. SLBN-146 TaxID=2768457 RepID=UPI001150A84B|nr:DUF4166 domain-containing protein [Microbacterium sp. SLBN-146]TQJ30549.1 uncharacterized protein DUF4166 [Microbacterium sp. SLBN-146]
MRPSTSVYERVLGPRFGDLDPRLTDYFGALPPGTEGVGHGTFAAAGLRRRGLWPVFAVLARLHILFPEYERDVAFTVVNTGDAQGALRGIRSFHLRDRTRTMQDMMAARGDRIVDRIGRGGLLEATFRLDVEDGGLRMTSEHLALRIGRLRFPLPRFATVTVDEAWRDSRQHVDVRVRMPLLGDVFAYAGSFTYATRATRTTPH